MHINEFIAKRRHDALQSTLDIALASLKMLSIRRLDLRVQVVKGIAVYKNLRSLMNARVHNLIFRTWVS